MFRLLFILSLLVSPSLSAQHTIIMKDGTQKKGKVQAVRGPVLTLFTNGRPLEMLVSDVRTVHFFDEAALGVKSSANLMKKFKMGFDEIEYVMEGRKMVKFPKICLLYTSPSPRD